MIKTDGISCSLLFIKLDKNGEPCLKPKKTKKNLDNHDGFEYIEEVPITKKMKQKLTVCIDPNHGNLISCVAKRCEKNPPKTILMIEEDANGKTTRFKNNNDIKFRYTRSQRNVEIKKKKYNKIREDIKKTKIDKKSIKQIESQLSDYNSRICDIDEFTFYLGKKLEINRILSEHYSNPIYRKLNMNTYINTQKSEAKMMNEFKKKFGSSKNILIIFGDYSKRCTMKGCEPHISRRIKRLFRRYRYKVYLIDEYLTSQLCNKCHHQLERFMYVKDKDGNDHLLWGLLRCTNGNCKTIHNRDHNSSRNFQNIIESIFEGKGRPKKYAREKE